MTGPRTPKGSFSFGRTKERVVSIRLPTGRWLLGMKPPLIQLFVTEYQDLLNEISFYKKQLSVHCGMKVSGEKEKLQNLKS